MRTVNAYLALVATRWGHFLLFCIQLTISGGAQGFPKRAFEEPVAVLGPAKCFGRTPAHNTHANLRPFPAGAPIVAEITLKVVLPVYVRGQHNSRDHEWHSFQYLVASNLSAALQRALSLRSAVAYYQICRATSPPGPRIRGAANGRAIPVAPEPFRSKCPAIVIKSNLDRAACFAQHLFCDNMHLHAVCIYQMRQVVVDLID
jgi:hypothetical protein